MGGYKHNQLKGRSYDEIQKLFDKEMKRVNSFVAMNLEVQEISRKKDESSLKKQKTNENEEVEEDNEVELKIHMVIVKDDDIAFDAILLATKSPVIGIDREDLETLWKLVKTKHGDTRPDDEHERVLWVLLVQKVYAAGLQLLEELLLSEDKDETQEQEETLSEHLYSASAIEIDKKKPELKDLPSHIEYAYLKGDETCPVIISSKLTEKEKTSLLWVLEKRNSAIT
ncbi:hypothetical protein Tco_1184626 [Tanacetum coccineum]